MNNFVNGLTGTAAIKFAAHRPSNSLPSSVNELPSSPPKLACSALLALLLLCVFFSNMPAAFAEAEKADESKATGFKTEDRDDDSELSEYWQEDGKNYNLAYEKGSKLERKSEHELALQNGTFLVESEGNIILRTPVSVVRMKPHSMALIRIKPDSERFLCLMESVTVASSTISALINYGEEALLQNRDFNQALKKDLTGENDVAVRRTKVIADKENGPWKMATMEFSLMHAMEREPLLNQISHSKHPHDKFLRDKLVKSAAILQMFTNSHGEYSN